MTLTPGTRVGPYEIVSALGAGGMGEVYRARDTTLHRDVAVKVLPESFATDPDRLARFQREAQVLASLNHPHIAHIHGLEHSGGVRGLVMEFVEGEDLAQRLARGPIPIDEALPIAKQITEALEAAHEQGIIHRDLKPANIKVRPDGVVKVLDFGLAKALELVGTAPNVTQSATTTTPAMTQAGIILGTAAYMSPEQARGRPVDRRADIWAFGVVLFEMLTGRPVFAGDTITDVLMGVMTAEPDWSTLPAGTSVGVRRLLRRCLQKDPRMRLPDIGSARLELSEVLSGVTEQENAAPARGVPGPSTRHRNRARWLLAVLAPLAALALVGATAALVARRQSGPGLSRPFARLSLQTPADLRLTPSMPPLISPDGRHVIIGSRRADGSDMLWIRQMDSFEFQPLPGTEEATDPFWSPDSRDLAFVVNAQLRRVRIGGGGVQTLCKLESSYAAGGTWNEQGTLVLSNGATPPGATLVTVPAGGGRPAPLTTLDQTRGEVGHYSPHFLPDGRHFAFIVRSTTPQHSGVYLASLDAPHERHRLLGQPSTVWFAREHLLFVRGTTLLAQRFDTRTRQAQGEPYPIVDAVDGGVPGTEGLFSASGDGVVVYRPSRGHNAQLAWVGRNGGTLSTVGDPQPYAQLALSPDERRVAVELPDAAGRYDIWTIELARGVPTRVTFDPADDRDPVWSPDGTALLFGSRRKGRNTLFRKSLTGRGPESELFDTKSDLYPESWTPDGKAILYLVDSGELRVGWMWAVDGHTAPLPLVNTGFTMDELQVSPDGQRLAYVSLESGRYEVYVEPFGRTGENVRISSEGGGQPKWRRDGKELFYLAPNGTLMGVEIRHGAQIGLPTPLFDLGDFDAEIDDYAPSGDGQRFLIKRPLHPVVDVSVHVVLNWETRVK